VLAEQLLVRVGFLSVAVMAAKMGTAAFAAHQVGMNVMSLSFSFGDGMQVAAVALIGQSLGARNVDMAKMPEYRTDDSRCPGRGISDLRRILI
uniref:MATE family efflux transporter n=1 Tax=Eisenbergiella tayi TaxID=1432052 RepID=UPI003FED8F9B